MSVLKDISTGKDGETYDCVRVYGGLAILVFLSLSIADFVVTLEFNYMAFGTGFAAIIGSMGGALWAKQGTEP